MNSKDPARHTFENGAYQKSELIEALERMRRLETRVTNVMRSVGLMPGVHTPPPLEGSAIYKDGTVHVSSPSVTLGEVAKAAVLGCDSDVQEVQVILCNQPWGALRIHKPIPPNHKGKAQ